MTWQKSPAGCCLSRWEDTRPNAPHVCKHSGLIHGQDLDAFDLPQLEKATLDSLLALQKQFPAHVLNPRVVGFAFAFDLPSPNLAQQLIAQRFYRGFMVYIAGTQTVRYRLNTLITQEDLNRLFAGIADAMNYILKSAEHLEGPGHRPIWTRSKRLRGWMRVTS